MRDAILHGDSGITAVEVLAVMLCGLVLAAMAVPDLHGLQNRWSLWGGAWLVETSLQWGRMYAVSANAAVSFEIGENGKSFYWSDPQSGERYESSIRFLPGKVRITGYPRRPLRFYQRGNAVPAGTYVVEGDGGICRVIVNPAGRIRIQWN